MGKQICGLLGRTLGHSWSAPIHRELGNPDYRLIELEPEALGAFLERADIRGLNVTMPYKQAVLPFCDVVDPTAAEIGSVNTLARRKDGKLYAWNTDVLGFLYMAQRAGVSLAGRKVLILGGGGTSRTVQAAARRLEAREIVVISRRGPDHYQNLHRHRDGEVIINTTPLGMYPHTGEAAVDLTEFPNCKGVLDVVYNPRRTALLLQAEALGIPHSDGLPMLVAQATASSERFFQCTTPPKETERILRLLRQETGNIVLIGMPGCGKSTVGKALAAVSGRELVDLDAAVAAAAGKTIPEIFAQDGETAFRALERQVTARHGAESGKILITGGGVVKDQRNYASLHQNGRIYQLFRDADKLDRTGRPLSQGADLHAMERERAPMYARFRDVGVDNNRTAAEAAAEIWQDYCVEAGRD